MENHHNLKNENTTYNYLQELGIKHGTDKAGHRYNNIGYLDYYNRYFHSIRYEVKIFVEIGILGGKSLRMWEEYFPNAIIYGIDINPICKSYETDRIKIFIGSQNNVTFLNEIKETIGNIDILLDDGSHITKHQITTFDVLYPSVNKGGFYVIEDLANSYEENLNIHDIRHIWPGMGYNDASDDLKNYRIDFSDWILNKIKNLDMLGYQKDNASEELKNSKMIGIHFYPMVLILENNK